MSTANSTFAIGGGSSPLDIFVIAENFVLRKSSVVKIPSFAKRQNVIANY
jgi:hypothetical protein